MPSSNIQRGCENGGEPEYEVLPDPFQSVLDGGGFDPSEGAGIKRCGMGAEEEETAAAVDCSNPLEDRGSRLILQAELDGGPGHLRHLRPGSRQAEGDIVADGEGRAILDHKDCACDRGRAVEAQTR